jgi:hypothetical protein
MIVSGQGGARAASQAGGLPAVSDRVSALEGIARTLQAAVTALQTQVTTLQTANANLQSSLNNLQTALNTETAARTAGDTTLQAAVTQKKRRVVSPVTITCRIRSTPPTT